MLRNKVVFVALAACRHYYYYDLELLRGKTSGRNWTPISRYDVLPRHQCQNTNPRISFSHLKDILVCSLYMRKSGTMWSIHYVL